MKRIFIGTQGYMFPSHWNELSKNDLLKVANLLTIGYSAKEMVIALIVHFTGKTVEDLKLISPYIFEKVEKEIGFLLQDIRLTKQLLPEITIGLRKYEGPKEWLTNMNFEQFVIFSETYFFQYLHTKKEADLNLFLATLYTRKGKEFEPKNIEKNAKKIAKLHPAIKLAIVLFYQGNRNFIANKFQLLFPQLKKEKIDNNQQYDFLLVLDILNKGDVAKNNAIKQTNIYEIFTRLTNLIKKGDE